MMRLIPDIDILQNNLKMSSKYFNFCARFMEICIVSVVEVILYSICFLYIDYSSTLNQIIYWMQRLHDYIYRDKPESHVQYAFLWRLY